MGGDWGVPADFESVTAISSGFQQNINSGGGFLAAGTFDMRGFSSYYLRQDAVTTGAAAYNAVRANMIWSTVDDSLSVGASDTIRKDYEWWASTGPPAANQEAMFSGILGMQGKMYGSFLNLSWSNFGTSNIALSWNLFGSNRLVTQDFQNMSPYDDMVYENAAIAAPLGTYQIPLPMYYGRLGFHRENIGGGASTVLQIRWGSAPLIYAYHTMVSNVVDGNPQNFELFAPMRPAIVILSNSTAATTNRLVITTQRDRV